MSKEKDIVKEFMEEMTEVEYDDKAEDIFAFLEELSEEVKKTTEEMKKEKQKLTLPVKELRKLEELKKEKQDDDLHDVFDDIFEEEVTAITQTVVKKSTDAEDIFQEFFEELDKEEERKKLEQEVKTAAESDLFDDFDFELAELFEESEEETPKVTLVSTGFASSPTEEEFFVPGLTEDEAKEYKRELLSFIEGLKGDTVMHEMMGLTVRFEVLEVHTNPKNPTASVLELTPFGGEGDLRIIAHETEEVSFFVDNYMRKLREEKIQNNLKKKKVTV